MGRNPYIFVPAERVRRARRGTEGAQRAPQTLPTHSFKTECVYTWTMCSIGGVWKSLNLSTSMPTRFASRARASQNEAPRETTARACAS